MSRPRRSILVGDALEHLRHLPDGYVDSVVTSPPYFRLRDYQADGQLGLEAHVEDWVSNLRIVLTEAARVLTPTGTLWLNLGDTYATTSTQGAAGRKGLLLAPERLAHALSEDGWLIRNKIIWAKTNHAPSSVTDRLTCGWEVIYLLTRSPRYFFDLDAIRIPATSRAPTRSRGAVAPTRTPDAWRGPNTDGKGTGLAGMRSQGRVAHPLGKNPTDVWPMSVSNYRGAHHATFPLHLAERMVKAGTPEQRCTLCRAPWKRPIRRLGAAVVRLALTPTCQCKAPTEAGLVLDPFLGSGTTAIAAERHGRDWLGIELNPDFAEQARVRITAARTTNNSYRKEVA